MTPRQLRPAQSVPRRAVAPFHSGPQAASGNTGPAFTNSPHAALLIDFDNVTMGIRSDLQAELRTLLSNDIVKGKLTVQRAYADWRRYPQYILPLTESSIDLIWAPAYGSAKKNATDIRLAIDALELVFTRPEIGTFILLSGDSDFSTLVIKLKEYGKYVIGVGIRESSSDLLVMNCDEYYSYNALAGLVKSGEDESTRWDPYQLVTEALNRMKRNDDVMRSDRLKQVMQEIDASFDEKDLGMPKFSRFVQEAAHRGLIKVSKLESGQLEVDLPDGSSNGDAPQAKAPAAENAPEARRDRDQNGDRDRGGRRNRRGRGRDRETAEHRVVATPAVATPAAAMPTVVDTISTDIDPAQAPAAAVTPTVTPTVTPAAASAAAATTASSGKPAPAGARTLQKFGASGERLTRNDAFDLVKRAVESLVTGGEAIKASAVRQRAYELLGRDSESLSERGFERILKDAHDADRIDLRRRGNDFEVARAVEEAPIQEQLKVADDALKAADAAASVGKTAPRGMAHRGIGGKSSMAGRSRSAAELPADLLKFGVVASAKAKAPPAGESEAAVAGAADAGSKATKSDSPAASSGAQEAAKDAPGAKRTARTQRKSGAAKKAAKSAAKSAAKAAAKTAATGSAAGEASNKTPVKTAARTAAKAADKTAPRSAAKTATKDTAKSASNAAGKTAVKKTAPKSSGAKKSASAKTAAKTQQSGSKRESKTATKA